MRPHICPRDKSNGMAWYEILLTLAGGGGITYLIVEKLFTRRRDNADSKGAEIQNASEAAKLYKEIDDIVKSKTQPIEEKLDRALVEIGNLRTWRCYRGDCHKRVQEDVDAEG